MLKYNASQLSYAYNVYNMVGIYLCYVYTPVFAKAGACYSFIAKAFSLFFPQNCISDGNAATSNLEWQCHMNVWSYCYIHTPTIQRITTSWSKCVCLCGACIESAANTRVMHVFCYLWYSWFGTRWMESQWSNLGRLNWEMYYFFSWFCCRCHGSMCTVRMCMFQCVNK